MFEKIIGYFIAVVVLVTITFLCIEIPKTVKRDNLAEAIAHKENCIYIGHPRDLGSVHFMDCNGIVKVYRVTK